MADLRTLTLALVADVDKFKKGLNNAENETKTFSSKLGKTLQAGALAFAALGTAAFTAGVKIGKDALLAAADFNEEISKSEVIFGNVAKDVQDFAKKSVRAIGLNRGEALRASSNFATFGKAAGLSGKELADFSTDFVTLASDLASFNNTTPEQAIQAIGSALRGENEPIRNYGVLINEAALKQIALRDGIIDTTNQALTPQEKILATTKILFEQTLDAQGDFERTKDSFTNTLKIFRQSWADIRIELGEKLLPTFTDLLKFISDQALPALGGLVRGLTGGPRTVQGATKEANSAFAELGIIIDENDQAAFDLGVSLRDLTKTIEEVFFAAEEGTKPESGLVRFIKFIDGLITKLDTLIARFGSVRDFLTVDSPFFRLGEAIGESISGNLTGSRSQSQDVLNNIARNQRNTPTIVNNNINVRGAIDPQGTARTVTKVLTQQRAISGVRVTAPSGFF